MPPRIPIQAQKPKADNKPKLSGNSTTLGTIETGKKEWKGPTIPRSAIMPRAHRTEKVEEVVEKRGHWSDKTIPGMFLDAEYVCNIIRTLNKKNQEEIEYDWQVIANTGSKFPVNHFYVDSDGDLILSAKVGDSFVTQIVMNDENLAKEIVTTTTQTVSRRSSSNINTEGLVEICTLSYGDYNSAFGGSQSKDAEFDGNKLSDYIHYDRRDYKYTKPDNTEGTKYVGALMCPADGLEYWTFAIKEMNRLLNKKSLVFNN